MYRSAAQQQRIVLVAGLYTYYPPLAPPRRGMWHVDGWWGGWVQPPRPADTPPMEGNVACGWLVGWLGTTTPSCGHPSNGGECGMWMGCGWLLCLCVCGAKPNSSTQSPNLRGMAAVPRSAARSTSNSPRPKASRSRRKLNRPRAVVGSWLYNTLLKMCTLCATLA